MTAKILFLVQLPPPVHGASVVNQAIKNSNYINNKFDCRFVNLSPANLISEIGKFSFRKFIKSFHILFCAVKEFFLFKPDIVYMTLSPHGIAFYKDGIVAIVLRALGASLVFHLHGKGIANTIKSGFIKKNIYRFVFNSVDVIHLAPSLFSDVSQVVSLKSKMYTLANGIRQSDLLNIYENGAKEGKLVFLYLSNLIPTKGIDTLISAINQLDISLVDNVCFHIVGGTKDSSFDSAMKNLVIDSWKNSVKFFGPLYGAEKERMLREADVFVLPTRFKNECFPLSILEAMANRLAVISTYEGAIPDIIEPNTNGFLVNATDVKDLANKISLYIRTPGLAKKHGLNGYDKFANLYTMENFEINFCNIVDDIFARRHGIDRV